MVNVIVLVGASKGFGKSLLEALLSENLLCGAGQQSVFLLLTTSRERSICAWNEIFAKLSDERIFNGDPARVNLIVEEVDLSNEGSCLRAAQVLHAAISQIGGRMERFLVFMNAGSVNPVGPFIQARAQSLADGNGGSDKLGAFHDSVIRNSHINFISYTVLLRCLANIAAENIRSNPAVQVRIVNVSSLAAIQPLYGLGVYCSLKAARDMLLKNMALEIQREFPANQFRVLNYAPGPMKTELVRVNLLADDASDNELKKYEGDFVDPLSSAKRCVSLLTSPEMLDKWRSGDHIDYFDDIGSSDDADSSIY
jgi:NAD(P)-dependent dehydrogenase (short-subunit alcohol dehydrogenase family)